MKPIFLIGFMGCGKTTLGRALQAATGLQLIDLDELIEDRQGLSIRQIFAERGEAAFREIEHRILEQVSATENAIIACGGGTPCYFNNLELMNRAGVCVYLEASVGRLHERLLVARQNRPLIAAMTDDQLRDYILQMLEKRNPFYSRAAEIFCADRLDNETQIADSVAEFCRRFIPENREKYKMTTSEEMFSQ